MESNGAFPTGILQLPKQLFWVAGGKKKKKSFYFIKQIRNGMQNSDLEFIFKGQKYYWLKIQCPTFKIPPKRVKAFACFEYWWKAERPFRKPLHQNIMPNIIMHLLYQPWTPVLWWNTSGKFTLAQNQQNLSLPLLCSCPFHGC